MRKGGRSMTVKTVNDRNALNTHVRAVKQAKNTVRFIFALLITLVFIFPIFWMVSTSLKPEDEVLNATQTLLPVKWQFSNYATVMRKEPFLRYMLNTAIVTAGSMLLELSTGILAAYSFARGRYRGKHAMFIFVLGAMMVPIQVTFVPLYVMIARAGLKNTYLGLIIVGAVSPYTIFMLRQAFMGVDESYLDAARVDGMGKLGVIFRIMVPMCKPTLITMVLMSFIGGWNTYFWPSIIANDSVNVRVLTLGLMHLKQSFSGESIRNYHEIMAGALISILPVLIMFAIFQKQMLSGYTKAAMK